MVQTVVELVVLLSALLSNIYVALDARATPASVFAAVGRSRTAWMTLSLFGAFLFIVGVGIAAFYLLRVRPALRDEIAVQGLQEDVSARVKLTRYLLPALALAIAIVLGARSAGL